MNQWRKFEDEKGFPYYVNENNQSRSWDHPDYTLIKQRLDECNNIKYSTYRLAAKFRVLQQSVYMNDVLLATINGVFEKHRLGVNENSLILESYDLEAVLSDIFFATNKQFNLTIDIDLATELTINLLYNVFDSHRRGTIQVFSTKLILAILSKCNVQELYKFLFAICADHNNCMTRLKLRFLLTQTMSAINYLHEDGNYCRNFVDVVDNCFSNSPGLIGIDESTFLVWMENQQYFLHFIPVLYRLRSSELVVNHLKCVTCKITPTIGLRYKCMKCYNYIQCQQCFFTGRTNHSHKTTHLMREYCFQGISKCNHSFIKRLCSLLRCTRSNANVKINMEQICLHSPCEETNIQPLSSPQVQLELIIRQLELNNRDLQQITSCNRRKDKTMKSYLETHRMQVSAQISKLKILLDHLQSTQPLLVNPNPNQYEEPRLEQTNGENHAVEVQNDLDEVLAKLQQILANNFILDESLGGADNGQLKSAVNEVEGMLTSLIDNTDKSQDRETAVF